MSVSAYQELQNCAEVHWNCTTELLHRHKYAEDLFGKLWQPLVHEAAVLPLSQTFYALLVLSNLDKQKNNQKY